MNELFQPLSFFDRLNLFPIRRMFCFADNGAAGAGGGASASPPSGGEASPASAAPAAPSSGSSGSSPGAGDGTNEPPAEGESGSEANFDSLFEGMDGDFDSIDLGAQPTGTEPGVGEAPQGAPKAPQKAPKAATPAETPPGTPPKEPAAAAAAAPPAGNESSTPRSPLEGAIEGFKASSAELSQWAAQNLFQLSEADVEALDTNAAQAIPQIAGRVYTQAMMAAANLIRNFVPQMVSEGVQQHTARSAKATEALNQFYAAHPQLNPLQHGAAVEKWSKSFRAANPKATRAEAIAFVGRAVASELGINLGVQTQPPTAPAVGGGGPRPAPFAPARPGARVPEPPPVDDPYGGLDADFD